MYETLAAGSPHDMVPSIRNILGGFLFSGDDVYKKAGVLSGGERTRLAVARMLLRPSNTLLLDEPTNHLDLDSKDVLLEAIEDYGGTLILVSHDRYFVEKLATKIIEVGHGEAIVYPGTYAEFLWSKEQERRPAPATLSRHTRCDIAPGEPPVRRPKPATRSRSRTAKPSGARRHGNPHPTRGRRPKPVAATAMSENGSTRTKEKTASDRYAEQADRGTGSADRRPRGQSQGARGGYGGARVLRRPRRSEAGDRPASGADVGGRRPHGPVGGPPGTRRRQRRKIRLDS